MILGIEYEGIHIILVLFISIHHYVMLFINACYSRLQQFLIFDLRLQIALVILCTMQTMVFNFNLLCQMLQFSHSFHTIMNRLMIHNGVIFMMSIQRGLFVSVSIMSKEAQTERMYIILFRHEVNFIPGILCFRRSGAVDFIRCSSFGKFCS